MINLRDARKCPMHSVGVCSGKRSKTNGEKRFFSQQEFPDCTQNCMVLGIFSSLIEQSGSSYIKLAEKKLKSSKEDLKDFERIKTIKKDIVDFVSEGNNLLITTPHIQNGKTTLLLKFLYSYLWLMSIWYPPDEGRGKYVNVPEFVQRIEAFSIRNSEKFQNEINVLKNIALVVWDDITMVALNDTAKNIITSIISARLRNGKANIFAGLEVNNPDIVLGNILYQHLQNFEHLRITKKYKANKPEINDINFEI